MRRNRVSGGQRKQEQTSFLGWVLQVVIVGMEGGGSAMMELTAQNSQDIVELTVEEELVKGTSHPTKPVAAYWST